MKITAELVLTLQIVWKVFKAFEYLDQHTLILTKLYFKNLKFHQINKEKLFNEYL